MAGVWKPKKKVACDKCAWTGTRAVIHKKCPRCGHWYPRPVTAPAPACAAAEHCQNGRADICRAGQRDGVVCPPDSCDIDDEIRPQDDDLVTPQMGTLGCVTERR